jgi:probable rRNA maturation factor
MLEVDILDRQQALPVLDDADVRRLCRLAAESVGVRHGHLAVEFVDPGRIAELNTAYRDEPAPTDVLSFPIDGADAARAGAGAARGGMCELGDVVICPAHTADLREAIVHGVLHLVGMDHEHDDGEMLALQRELLAVEGP